MRQLNLFTLFVLLISMGSVGFAKSKVLLVISELDHRGIKELGPLYEQIESLSWKIPSQSALLPKIYSKMDLLKDSAATVEGAKEFILRYVADADVDQIDVILGVHGRPDKLAFYDGSVNVSEWTRAMRDSITRVVGLEALGKLGMLYNLSCYGSSHISAFQSLGFKVVIGSRKVNANAEFEYPWVLKGMSLGLSVAEAFRRPNSSRWLNLADGPVRWLGQTQNNFLKETDSFKELGGNLNYKIY